MSSKLRTVVPRPSCQSVSVQGPRLDKLEGNLSKFVHFKKFNFCNCSVIVGINSVYLIVGCIPKVLVEV